MKVFTDVLELCARSGLGKLGTVAIDGTKIAANASDDAMRSEKWLRQQAGRILSEAQDADAEEDALFGDARGDELPVELADPATRAERIARALADIEAEKAAEEAERANAAEAYRDAAQAYEQLVSDVRQPPGRGIGRPPRAANPVVIARARLEREIARAQGQIDKYAQRAAQAAAQGLRPKGLPPLASVEDYRSVKRTRAALEAALEKAQQAPIPAPAEQGKVRHRNITDPDARSMPTSKGWATGYNNQLAVSADQVIIALRVGQSPTDTESFVPMLARTQHAADLMTRCGSLHAQIGTVLADAGYRSEANITAPGQARLIATGKHQDDVRRVHQEPASGSPQAEASPLEAMDHRPRTPQGQQAYRDRGHLVEGANGQTQRRHRTTPVRPPRTDRSHQRTAPRRRRPQHPQALPSTARHRLTPQRQRSRPRHWTSQALNSPPNRSHGLPTAGLRRAPSDDALDERRTNRNMPPGAPDPAHKRSVDADADTQ